MKPPCTISDCTNPVLAKALCGTHYRRLRRGQDLNAPLRPKAAYRDPEVLASYTTQQGSCLIWQGEVRENGYGYLYVGTPTKTTVHRWAYQEEHGPIPAGMDVDHTCGNRACYNTRHLRLTTRKQNLENITTLNRNNESGYRGVQWSTQKRKWQVRVKHNYQEHYGGAFDDVHEAGEAARQLRNNLYTHNLRDRQTPSTTEE